MIRVLIDFRKTALIAGIAIAAAALWIFFLQLLFGPHGSTSNFVAISAHFLIILLLELPLAVFLLLLYRTGITPALSRNLRLVAAALVAIRGAYVLLDIRETWRAGITPVARHTVSSATSQSWFFLSPASHWLATLVVITGTVNVGSELAFVVFLVALACQGGPSQNADKHASRQVRNAALTAIFARTLLIIFLLISFQVYAHAVRTYGTVAPLVLVYLRNLLFELPGLIAPWIILASVNRSSRIANADSAKQQPQPDSTASAHSDAAASSPEA